MIIDEKGRLFGWINIFDLLVLVGLVVVAYLGLTLVLALHETAIEVNSVSPAEITLGNPTDVNLGVKNEHTILSGLVRLIPEDFSGETVQLALQVNKGDRGNVKFTTPPMLAAGRYRVELELLTQDALQRKTRRLAQPSDKFFSVLEPQKQNGFWQIEADALVPDGGRMSGGISSGQEYADSSGTYKLRVESLGPASAADLALIPGLSSGPGPVRMAHLKIIVPVYSLNDFQGKYMVTGGRLALAVKDGYQAIVMTGRGDLKPTLPEDVLQWDLDMQMLVITKEQRAAIRVGARQIDDRGVVQAEIIQVLGEEATDWITDPAAAGKAGNPTNIRVRMRLLCELHNGRLVFGGLPLEPKSILRFNLEGQEVSGSVVGQDDQAGLRVQLNLYIPTLSRRIADNLRPGVFLLDPSSRKPVGIISRILASGAANIPDLLQTDSQAAARAESEYRQVLIRVSFDCDLQTGGLYAGGQVLDSKRDLTFSVFSDKVSGRITELTSLGESELLDVEIVFPSIDPSVADRIRPGLKESTPEDVSETEISAVLSDKPSRLYVVQGGVVIATGEDPQRRDLRCRAKIKVTRQDEFYFFRGNQLMIGVSIPFRTSRFALNGQVVNF